MTLLCTVRRHASENRRPNFYLISSIDGKYESRVEQLNSSLENSLSAEKRQLSRILERYCRFKPELMYT